MKKPPEYLICPFCSYDWYSNAKLDWVTCPNCQRRFDRKRGKNE